MSLADSFILGVLRGWRLLQAASLNHEEKRDILTPTSNSLDYHAVARALQTLWDDQMFIPRKGNHHSQYNNNMYHDVAYVEDDDWSDDWSSWASHDWWDAAWTEDGHMRMTQTTLQTMPWKLMPSPRRNLFDSKGGQGQGQRLFHLWWTSHGPRMP